MVRMLGLVCRRVGSGCVVASPCDYGSLVLAAHVSLGAGACRYAGNERKVSVGVTEASVVQQSAVVPTGRRHAGVRGCSTDVACVELVVASVAGTLTMVREAETLGLIAIRCQ